MWQLYSTRRSIGPLVNQQILMVLGNMWRPELEMGMCSSLIGQIFYLWMKDSSWLKASKKKKNKMKKKEKNKKERKKEECGKSAIIQNTKRKSCGWVNYMVPNDGSAWRPWVRRGGNRGRLTWLAFSHFPVPGKPFPYCIPSSLTHTVVIVGDSLNFTNFMSICSLLFYTNN